MACKVVLHLFPPAGGDANPLVLVPFGAHVDPGALPADAAVVHLDVSGRPISQENLAGWALRALEDSLGEFTHPHEAIAKRRELVLLSENGIESERRLVLEGEHGSVFKIGRSQVETHLLVFDPRISRVHCELVLGDNGVELRDKGSTHGTLVNGDKVSGRRLLDNGDEVEIGNSLLKYYDYAMFLELPDELEASEPTRARAAESERQVACLAGTVEPQSGDEEPDSTDHDPAKDTARDSRFYLACFAVVAVVIVALGLLGAKVLFGGTAGSAARGVSATIDG